MSDHTRSLTAAQTRYLAEIRTTGAAGRRYNGRAWKPLEALEAAGLIKVDWDLHIGAMGNSHWRLTASPLPCHGCGERYTSPCSCEAQG